MFDNLKARNRSWTYRSLSILMSLICTHAAFGSDLNPESSEITVSPQVFDLLDTSQKRSFQRGLCLTGFDAAGIWTDTTQVYYEIWLKNHKLAAQTELSKSLAQKIISTSERDIAGQCERIHALRVAEDFMRSPFRVPLGDAIVVLWQTEDPKFDPINQRINVNLKVERLDPREEDIQPEHGNGPLACEQVTMDLVERFEEQIIRAGLPAGSMKVFKDEIKLKVTDPKNLIGQQESDLLCNY